MTADDYPRFVAALSGAAEVLGTELSPERIEGYGASLGDMPIEAIRRGLARALGTMTRFPFPIEIRNLGFGTGTAVPPVTETQRVTADPLRQIEAQAEAVDATPLADDIANRPDKYAPGYRINGETVGALKAKGYVVPKQGESGAAFFRRTMAHMAAKAKPTQPPDVRDQDREPGVEG